MRLCMKRMYILCAVLFSTVSVCMQEDQKEAVKLFFEQSMKSARETKNLKMVWTLEQCKAIVDAQTDDELITAYARAAHMGAYF